MPTNEQAMLGEAADLNPAAVATIAKTGAKKKRRNARKEKLEALRHEELFLDRENEIMQRAIESVRNVPALRETHAAPRAGGCAHAPADSN